MKRKNNVTTDLRSFMARAAAKKRQPEPESVPQSCNQSLMQMVVFEGQSGSGQAFDSGASTSRVPSEPARATEQQPADPPIAEVNESSSDDEDNDDYDLEHDPGLRRPISSYPINDQDSVRRAYIAMGRCQPKMKR